ncbi:hypothetical protein CYMTET_52521 [Cymbomonas tetramitiformis]|uniref:Tr-type G domain-containing protein n=1 Tax=Cymbomonas tetramitiformis TaxID=36881 RepID=A0AAE0BKP2_9CHLO|nr:hypothetical protein CYMTET_52521 [Cymbomonas tetramitiformis]
MRRLFEKSAALGARTSQATSSIPAYRVLLSGETETTHVCSNQLTDSEDYWQPHRSYSSGSSLLSDRLRSGLGRGRNLDKDEEEPSEPRTPLLSSLFGSRGRGRGAPMPDRGGSSARIGLGRPGIRQQEPGAQLNRGSQESQDGREEGRTPGRFIIKPRGNASRDRPDRSNQTGNAAFTPNASFSTPEVFEDDGEPEKRVPKKLKGVLLNGGKPAGATVRAPQRDIPKKPTQLLGGGTVMKTKKKKKTLDEPPPDSVIGRMLAAKKLEEQKKSDEAAGVTAQPLASEEPDQVEQAREVELPDPVTISELARALGVRVEDVAAILADLGEAPKSQDTPLNADAVELAVAEFGAVAKRVQSNVQFGTLEPRPAVITVMGHVDHGKTTLLDSLRNERVAEKEAGGITQHMGAFLVQLPDTKNALTFLDTPGHAAFSQMRARGAAVTDIVVLVVAADDGVMNQTKEALAHARAAGVAIVVAITKCDKPGVDLQRVRQQLMAEDMELEEAGGDIPVVEVSAKTGHGLVELQEVLTLQADFMDLRSRIDCDAEAVVVESRIERGQGPLATVIVTRGEMRLGKNVVVGTEWGRLRSITDTAGKTVTSAKPGHPIQITGLRGLPNAGDTVQMVASEERARKLSQLRDGQQQEKRLNRLRNEAAAVTTADGESLERGEVNLIIKAPRFRTLPPAWQPELYAWGMESAWWPRSASKGKGMGHRRDTSLRLLILWRARGLCGWWKGRQADMDGTAEAVRDAIATLVRPGCLVGAASNPPPCPGAATSAPPVPSSGH